MKKKFATGFLTLLLSFGLTGCFDSEQEKPKVEESMNQPEQQLVNEAETANKDATKEEAKDSAASETQDVSKETNKVAADKQESDKGSSVSERAADSSKLAKSESTPAEKARVASASAVGASTAEASSAEAAAQSQASISTERKAVKARKTAKSARKSEVEQDYGYYSAEEVRLGLVEEPRLLSDKEIEFEKFTCRFRFTSPEEAKKYNCVTVRSVVR